MGISYKDSGVDLKAAEESTKSIGQLAKSTFNDNVLNDIGLFAGFYAVDLKKYPSPVIVSSIDGVGTKLKIAFMVNRHDTIGQCLVNHCVNDIMTCGADPVAFTDYIGTLELKPAVITEIIRGMSMACKENECALIGGETAEMPGFYSPGEYDLAGSIIGLVNRDSIIDGTKIKAGDKLIALPSNGLHTNGYSLARKVLLEHKGIDLNKVDKKIGERWGDVLLKVHKSYRKPIALVRNLPGVVGISHITGGGIEGNTKRLLGKELSLKIKWNSWTVLPEFTTIQEYGNISDEEMHSAFNMGIGLVFIVSKGYERSVIDVLFDQGENPKIIGSVI